MTNWSEAPGTGQNTDNYLEPSTASQEQIMDYYAVLGKLTEHLKEIDSRKVVMVCLTIAAIAIITKKVE